MKKNNIGSVLIYTLFMVFLASIMLLVVQNNITSLYINLETDKINNKLNDNIVYKTNLWFKYVRNTNSTGSGFIDNLSCPDSITMSGNTNSGIIASQLYLDSSNYFCSGSYLGNNLKIYFNSGFSYFDLAEYYSSFVNISSGIGNTNFLDSDNTLIDFSSSNYLSGDYIDDNFDSDNYIGNSSGVIDYPNNFLDNDDGARRNIYGYILPNTGYNSVFWSDYKIRQIINSNLNNTGSNTSLLGTSSGYIYLDIDGDFNLKLIKFDREKYENRKELYPLEIFTGTGYYASIGYIQNDLSLEENLTGNDYVFDFINNDYALFLENSGTGVLSYTLRGEDLDGKYIYITPINDSFSSVIEILGNDILIDDKGKYISKQLEIIKSK